MVRSTSWDAIILRLNYYSRRQSGLDVRDARLDPFGDRAAVLAGKHQRHANHRFIAVERRRASSKFGPGLYFGHIFDEQRRDAGAEFERQIGDVSALFTRPTARMVSVLCRG